MSGQGDRDTYYATEDCRFAIDKIGRVSVVFTLSGGGDERTVVFGDEEWNGIVEWLAKRREGRSALAAKIRDRAAALEIASVELVQLAAQENDLKRRREQLEGKIKTAKWDLDQAAKALDADAESDRLQVQEFHRKVQNALPSPRILGSTP